MRLLDIKRESMRAGLLWTLAMFVAVSVPRYIFPSNPNSKLSDVINGACVLLIALVGITAGRSRYRRLIAQWRRENLRCVKCGYDLHGNSTGVCPECGEPIKQNNPTDPLEADEAKMIANGALNRGKYRSRAE